MRSETLRAAGVTPREEETFWLVAGRLHNREIAGRLHVSERTVESHVSSLLRKLGGENRLFLIDTAARLSEPRSPDLPRPLSSFVGRAEQLEDLRRLLGAHRLVTLTGPAGAGKTRLALHLAAAETLPAPVLVDLASVPPGGPVDRAFAEALGVDGDGRAPRLAVRDALATGVHWLIVDNCEHVAAAVAALLADLLPALGRLGVLATSHGPLGVDGEVVYPVPPLDLPPDSGDPDMVLGAAAARLFADRAAAAAPGFTVDAGNAKDVATVCRRLDGLPLAIELAAARVRAFTPAELVARLADRFALLTGGAYGRHRTLDEALRWSYDLLEEDERLLFERCAVFPADFDYDTAAAALGYPPFGPSDLARLFPRLLDRSLLNSRRLGQTTQYRLLDSVRQFAHSRLAARGEAERARAEHARHHLRHAVALLDDLRGGAQRAALAWFERRWVDLGAAMTWAGTSDEAWEFLAGIGPAWEILGAHGELFDWLDTLLAAPLPAGDLGVRAAVTTTLLLCYQDTRRAHEFALRARDLAATEEEADLARLALGWSLMYGADRPAATRHLAEAADGFERRGQTWLHALTLSGLGHAEEDPHLSFTHVTRSADLFGQLHDEAKRANDLNHLALRAVESGLRVEAARGWLAEAAELADRTGNRHERLHSEVFLATLDQSQGDPSAAPRFAALLGEFRRIGDRRCVTRCLLGLGRAALTRGDHPQARTHLTAAARLATEIADTGKSAEADELLAQLLE